MIRHVSPTELPVSTVTNPTAGHLGAASPATLRFAFHGAGGEYFRVWIVNTMLSIITLGIYSAWAKVRNKQYFYANTRLDGSAFEYTANPVSILKGRAILLVAFLVYGVLVTLYPRIEPLMILAIVGLVPWVVVRAFAFNARYSSHRNVRFGFDGEYFHALAVYILLPVLGVISLGLAYPWAVYKKRQYFIDNSRYGATRFSFEGAVGRMYVIYLKAAALLAGPAVMLAVVWGMAIRSGAMNANGELAEGEMQPLPPELVLWMIVAIALFAIGWFVVAIYLQTAVSNYLWQHTRLRQNRFDLRLELARMLWIQFSNLVLIVVTFGLMIPFAKVRLARYRIERMTMLAVENPDAFAAAERERVSALGEEFGEALDLDLAM